MRQRVQSCLFPQGFDKLSPNGEMPFALSLSKGSSPRGAAV